MPTRENKRKTADRKILLEVTDKIPDTRIRDEMT
jgi:hypothetical protein